MERGTELKSIGGKIFLIKSRYPSGQLNYKEDYYDVICEVGSFRLPNTILKYLFENETERKQKEDDQKFKEKNDLPKRNENKNSKFKKLKRNGKKS